MICHDKKFLFIHIPKNAGKSMEYYMSGRKWWNPHSKARQMLGEIKKGKYEDYFKYTIVRNPFDRMVSMFHFFAQGMERKAQGRQLNELFTELGFDGFIKNFSEMPTLIPKWRGLGSQYGFICDDDFNILLDYIIYYENLDEGVKYLADRFDVERDFPHRNKSSHVDYRTYYDDELIEIVAQKFSKDIELFYPELDPANGRI